MMKAIAMEFKTGNTRRIEIEKPTTNSIAPNQVLVKVQYSAIDTTVEEVVNKTMTGYFTHARCDPLILGWHYSGTIEVVGNDVKHLFDIGNNVWGHLSYDPKQTQGTFSEYIVVDADKCAIVPKNIDLKVAAAAATETTTALQALRDLGGLTSSGGKKKSVLIIGAGGGVGSAAVGIAKRLGAHHVTALCSTKDVQRVKEHYGADVVLDRSKVDDIFAMDDMYDIVFDTPAKYSGLKIFKILNKNGGSYVTTLPSMKFLLAKFVSLFNKKKVSFVECQSKNEDLKMIGDWIANDGMMIDIDSTFPIRKLDEAVMYHANAKKKKVGRVVIDVAGGW